MEALVVAWGAHPACAAETGLEAFEAGESGAKAADPVERTVDSKHEGNEGLERREADDASVGRMRVGRHVLQHLVQDALVGGHGGASKGLGAGGWA